MSSTVRSLPTAVRLAYVSNDCGIYQVYVQPLPGCGTKRQVSTKSGLEPVWRRDGKELFYVPAPARFSAVAVKTAPIFSFTAPVDLPRGFGSSTPTEPRTFDIMADGRIVGVVASVPQSQVQQIHVVLNWFEELKAKVPVK